MEAMSCQLSSRPTGKMRGDSQEVEERRQEEGEAAGSQRRCSSETEHPNPAAHQGHQKHHRDQEEHPYPTAEDTRHWHRHSPHRGTRRSRRSWVGHLEAVAALVDAMEQLRLVDLEEEHHNRRPAHRSRSCRHHDRLQPREEQSQSRRRAGHSRRADHDRRHVVARGQKRRLGHVAMVSNHGRHPRSRLRYHFRIRLDRLQYAAELRHCQQALHLIVLA